MSGGDSLCRMVLFLYAERIEGGPTPRRGPFAAETRSRAAERRPLCREEAFCAGRSSVLRGLEEALCREETPVPRGGPVPLRGSPCAAERRPLCREEALCAGRSSVVRGLEEVLCREEAPVLLRGGPVPPRGGPCAERRHSVPEGLLCRKDWRRPCVGRRPLCC